MAMPRRDRKPEGDAARPGDRGVQHEDEATPSEAGAPRRRKRRNFYADALADEGKLNAAGSIDGIDDEIAVLRTALFEQMREQPEDYERIARSVSVLVRAVVAQYRMSPRSAEGFAEKVTAVVRELGDQMAPWLFTSGGGDV
jgi:hypothetical protein